MSEQIYQVRLPMFEGPLDLLLHLIEKRQMEIVTVSLVAVTDQFIEYLRTWTEPQMGPLAEFAAMASRLLLIKSRSLLPRTNLPEDEAAVAEVMADAEAIRRNLLEYKLAKSIAAALRWREEAGLHSFARQSAPLLAEETLVRAPPQLLGATGQALALAFRRALAASREREPEELPLPIVTVAEKIEEIEQLLAQSPTFDLMMLIGDQPRRIIIVVTFLAVLELWHQHRIVVRQDDPFGAIIIARAVENAESEPGVATAPHADDDR